jgi:hypothetical protein
VFPPVGGVVTGAVLLAAAVNLNKPPYYVRLGVVQLSLANVIVIALMLIVFVLALIVPFSKGRDGR